MLLQLHDICAQYAPHVALLRTQFCRPSVDMASFQRSLQAMAQLIEQNTVAEYLIDLHGSPDLSVSQQLWAATQWVPRVAVMAVQHAAIVIPKDGLYNQMAIEFLHRAAQPFTECEVQFFGTPASALDWLLSFQNPAAQAELEREWAAAGLAAG